MAKITSSKLSAQKLANLPKSIEKTLKECKKPIVDKELLIDSCGFIPQSELGASKNLSQAKAYLAEQAAKANCKKLAQEKADNLVK